MSKELDPEVKDIATYLNEGKTGPTKASVLVMRLVNDWETKHRARHDGIDVGTWLRKTFGRGAGIRFFELRYKAALRFSEKTSFDQKNWLRELAAKSALCMEHEALVWLDSHLKDSHEAKMIKAVGGEYVTNAMQPLTMEQIVRVYSKNVGKLPTRPRQCSGCAALRAELEQLKAAKAA